MSAVTAAARRAPGASAGGRPPPPGAAPKPRKAGGSSAGGRCGRPGLGPSWPGPGNWLGPRRLRGGRLLPGRAGVGLGLVSTHGCSADTGLFRRQSVRADAGRTRVRRRGPRATPPTARPRLPRLPVPPGAGAAAGGGAGGGEGPREGRRRGSGSRGALGHPHGASEGLGAAARLWRQGRGRRLFCLKEQGPPEARPHEGHVASAPHSARHGSMSYCPRCASGGPGDPGLRHQQGQGHLPTSAAVGAVGGHTAHMPPSWSLRSLPT